MRNRNRLEGSSFSWNCDYCTSESGDNLQFLSNDSSNISTTSIITELDPVFEIVSVNKIEEPDPAFMDSLETVENISLRPSSQLKDICNDTTAFVRSESAFLMKEAYEYIWNSLFASVEDDKSVSAVFELSIGQDQAKSDSKLCTSNLEDVGIIKLQGNNSSVQEIEVNSEYENEQETIDKEELNSRLDLIVDEESGMSLSEGRAGGTTSEEKDFEVEDFKGISSDNFISDFSTNELATDVPSIEILDEIPIVVQSVGSQPSFALVVDKVNQPKLNELDELSELDRQSNIEIEELVSLTFSVVRLQLLVALLAATVFLSLILVFRVYQFVIFYPTNLVFWLNEECERLIEISKFEQLISMLTHYLPRVEWLFGLKDLETIALVHYLARGQMALGRYVAALQNLEKLLFILQPYGENEYMASILEDCGFVYHALGKYEKAIQSLHKALRIISEEQVCRYEYESSQQITAKQFVNAENNDVDSQDHDRAIASDDSTIVADMNSSSLDSVSEKISIFEDDDALATSRNESSSSLLRSFGSPSTQDLNEAFYVHSNLTTAVKELEVMLDEDSASLSQHYQSAELANRRQDVDTTNSPTLTHDASTVFNDFIAAPSVEVARLCKKLGEVYRDNGEYAQASQFFQNAVLVATRINCDHSMERDIAELQHFIAQIKSNNTGVSIEKENFRSQSFDADTYNRFLVGNC
jgi:tetratricopeptide (TPR) repeat protein